MEEVKLEASLEGVGGDVGVGGKTGLVTGFWGSVVGRVLRSDIHESGLLIGVEALVGCVPELGVGKGQATLL